MRTFLRWHDLMTWPSNNLKIDIRSADLIIVTRPSIGMHSFASSWTSLVFLRIPTSSFHFPAQILMRSKKNKGIKVIVSAPDSSSGHMYVLLTFQNTALIIACSWRCITIDPSSRLWRHNNKYQLTAPPPRNTISQKKCSFFSSFFTTFLWKCLEDIQAMVMPLPDPRKGRNPFNCPFLDSQYNSDRTKPRVLHESSVNRLAQSRTPVNTNER